jgi:hypothetical protein
MALTALSRDDLAFGRAVLLATDALGMSAEGAFWLGKAGAKSWKFFLVTSLLHTMGPRDIYLRLNQALAKKLSERETREFSYYIAGPEEPLVSAVRGYYASSSVASDPVKVDFVLDGEGCVAWVYRMADPLADQQTKKARRQFQDRVRGLLVA